MSLSLKKKSESLSRSKSLSPVSSSTSESPFMRSTSINDTKIQKGDIQTIRQKWDGTQWHALCQYYTGDCIRYSGGIKHALLCDKHFKIHQTNVNEKYRFSSLIKQQEG
jgi:hypothetical protein